LFERNEILDKLPKHLLQYVNDQHYENYTSIDQAVWRYVMKKNIAYLPKVAHEYYMDGLAKSGISTEQIPSMYGMNRILQKIGWAAVAVDGYIPSAAFMEFQAYNVLVIAHDIRQVQNIEYTPAPDILHESAGHAPIIANPEYSEYLRRLGQIGCRAISSKSEHELYEVVRTLAITKENPQSTAKEIKAAQEKVDFVQNNMGESSEMSKIKNLHWWTVEYGLIGDLKNHKIYGAGLLSSIGESKSCLKKNVEKRWYDIHASNQNFDISKPQPHLFVTPDFAHLSYVLEEFANQMAVRTGGLSSIEKLIKSEELGTIEYNTGIQVSGVFAKVWKDENNRPIYFQTKGNTALSYQQKELIGHGILNHKDGFGSPIGKLKNINIPIEKMSPYDLSAYKIREGEYTTLEFEGGVKVEGEVITGKRSLKGIIILISFRKCKVSIGKEILFEPSYGIYNMAIGMEIVSSFAGPADHDSFALISHIQTDQTVLPSKNNKQLQLEALYAEVRNMRMKKKVNKTRLLEISKILKTNYPKDWLLLHEIKEIT
jgi:phenylalanine-4-hydroxylase